MDKYKYFKPKYKLLLFKTFLQIGCNNSNLNKKNKNYQNKYMLIHMNRAKVWFKILWFLKDKGVNYHNSNLIVQ